MSPENNEWRRTSARRQTVLRPNISLTQFLLGNQQGVNNKSVLLIRIIHISCRQVP
jgi:hypothetical protein